jgi:hypothetical protein
MIHSLDYFTKMLDAVEGDPTKLFPNAKSLRLSRNTDLDYTQGRILNP